VIGAISLNGQGLQRPTIDQCFELLTAEWPFVTYWFGEIFPNFKPPGFAMSSEIDMLKSVLFLWILQYGPSEIKNDPLWQDIVTTFNNASLDWSRLLE
jgi:hypothetical protein